jgi:hypothetical protein
MDYNMEIKSEYVTFKQGKDLKDLDFDVNVYHYFIDVLNEHTNHPTRTHDFKCCNWNSIERRVSAPEHHIVKEWLRLKYNIDIFSYPVLLIKNNVEQEQITRDYSFQVIVKGINQFVTKEHFEYNNPHDALSAAIDYSIKFLMGNKY